MVLVCISVAELALDFSYICTIQTIVCLIILHTAAKSVSTSHSLISGPFPAPFGFSKFPALSFARPVLSRQCEGHIVGREPRVPFTYQCSKLPFEKDLSGSAGRRPSRQHTATVSIQIPNWLIHDWNRSKPVYRKKLAACLSSHGTRII